MAEAKRRKTGNAETEEVAVRLISQFLLAEERVKELTSKRELVDDVLAGAVARGVVMYPNPEAKSQAALVPITLLPTPFAADCYLQAVELGPTFHELMDKVACDLPWMRQVLHETGKMDAICGRLLGICERVYGSGGKDHCRDVRLNIMRNDFMLDTRSGLGGHPMKQIEINMIAASFSTHGQDLTETHRYVLTKYLPKSLGLTPGALAAALPTSRSAEGIAAAMAGAHFAYSGRRPLRSRPCVVLFVADEDEKNELDHRKLEAALFQQHGVISLRRSLAQLSEQLATLLVPLEQSSAKVLVVDGREVSVAYFRSGYWPGQFSPLEGCWSAREAVEASEAVKCPSAPAQLAGMKKVQQTLCEPAELHRFLDADRARLLSQTFARQVDPSSSSADAQQAVSAAKSEPANWVLKPQVEGSGELFFDDDIPRVLGSRAQEQLAEFILMERIRPPVTPSAVLGPSGDVVVRSSVAELGIFGTFVADGQQVVRNEVVGHLLRSKGKHTNQGGVFVGNAVVDVPFLVPREIFWPSVTA